MLIAMPISGSIGHGLGLAMISYTIIKAVSYTHLDVYKRQAASTP